MASIVDELKKRTEQSLEKLSGEKPEVGYITEESILTMIAAKPLDSTAASKSTIPPEIKEESPTTAVGRGQAWCYGTELRDGGDRWVFEQQCNSGQDYYLLKSQIVSFQTVGFCGQWTTYKITYNY